MNEQLGQEILNALSQIKSRLDALESKQETSPKKWYTPDELAETLRRKPYTVREWCRNGRIRSEKDTYTGKRRIPVEEVNRLMAGGGLLPIEQAA
jgi:excisionase family DNA binding protein